MMRAISFAMQANVQHAQQIYRPWAEEGKFSTAPLARLYRSCGTNNKEYINRSVYVKLKVQRTRTPVHYTMTTDTQDSAVTFIMRSPQQTPALAAAPSGEQQHN